MKRILAIYKFSNILNIINFHKSKLYEFNVRMLICIGYIGAYNLHYFQLFFFLIIIFGVANFIYITQFLILHYKVDFKNI